MDKKNFAVTIRFSESERAWLEAEADHNGLGLGETVRRAIQTCQAQADAQAVEARLLAAVRSAVQEQFAFLK